MKVDEAEKETDAFTEIDCLRKKSVYQILYLYTCIYTFIL